MRIVMVGPYPEPGVPISGGVARVMDTLLPELGGQVDLTLVVSGAKADAETTSHGVRTIYLKRGLGPGAVAYWTADAHSLSRSVASIQPDIVHLQGVAGVGRLLSTPCLMTVHGIIDRDLITSDRGKLLGALPRLAAARLLKHVEQRGRRRASNIVVINPYVIEALPDIVDLRQFPICNPIDRVFCATKSAQNERPRRLISIGRIGARKNTKVAAMLAARVLALVPGASALFCGPADSNDYLSTCRSVIAERNAADRVTFAGSLGVIQLCEELDRSSVLIMTSRQETAPVAIAEAMARGVAVVAPEAFGIKYMITPGKNGFFLPDGDIEEQARVVRAALDHPWDRAEIAREARTAYSPQRVAEMTLAAYQAVLNEKR